MSVDSNYFYGVISFSIGIAAGFQAIHSRYPTDAGGSLFTLPGAAYVISRGIFPAAVFVVLYGYSAIHSFLWIYALGVGTGAEAILRSQFLIKQSPKAGGGIDEVLKGPLDLLRWYQDLFLGAIGTRRAANRLLWVRQHLPSGDFLTLAQGVLDNLAVFPSRNAELESRVSRLVADFSSDSTPLPAREKRYREKLGFTVEMLVGRTDFKTLFSL